MANREIERLNKYIEIVQTNLQILEQHSGVGDTEIFKQVAVSLLESFEILKRSVETGKPIAAGITLITPEIPYAFGIPFYHPCYPQILTFFLGLEELKHDYAEAERMGISSDICSAFRVIPYYAAAGFIPTPNVIIASAYACDAIATTFQILSSIKGWDKIPVYAFDAPWVRSDRGLEYSAGQVKGLIRFLEEHTGQKLSESRLRQVVDESNRQIELWQEYNELKRAVPCPTSANTNAIMEIMHQVFGDYTPKRTASFKAMVADAEQRVRTGQGAIENEKARILWADLSGVWTPEVFTWMEQQYGAVCVMDMYADCPYNIIDTASFDSMCRGLAERVQNHVPMIGALQGPVEHYIDRVAQLIADYKIDCVIAPGHMGHKDVGPVSNLLKDTCRDMDIPCLVLQTDLFDARVTSAQSVKKTISLFFDTVGIG